jgi:RNA polymerase sigma factor (sigma-70 family)
LLFVNVNRNKFWFCEVKYAEAWEEDTMTLRENPVARIAELLGLPVEVIRAYGKPRTGGAFGRVGKLGTVIGAGQPSSRLITLKGTEPPSKTGEDELYAQWCKASEKQKPDLEEKLFKEVLKHDTAVIWQKLGESNNDLAHDIASDTIKNLGKFREQSKFSTWVQGIANNQIKQELRRRKRSRRVFDEYSDVFEHVGDEKELTDPKASAAVLEMEDRRVREGLRKQLSAEEYVLLECMCERVSTAGIAERLKITDDAVESRCRRLKKKLQKIYSTRRNGK